MIDLALVLCSSHLLRRFSAASRSDDSRRPADRLLAAMTPSSFQKLKQVGWFVAFWILGVAAVAMVGFLIKVMLAL